MTTHISIQKTGEVTVQVTPDSKNSTPLVPIPTAQQEQILRAHQNMMQNMVARTARYIAEDSALAALKI